MSYIITASGRKFHRHQQSPDEISAYDIASGLSNMCRFSGHTREFYSVAQHCIHVAELMIRAGYEGLAIEGLLHDASEAYIADIAKPWKGFLPDYQAFEAEIMDRVIEQFGLRRSTLEGIVKHYDLVSLATEKRDLMPHDCEVWSGLEGIEPDPEVIVPMPPGQAKEKFLNLYHRLWWK